MNQKKGNKESNESKMGQKGKWIHKGVIKDLMAPERGLKGSNDSYKAHCYFL